MIYAISRNHDYASSRV